MATQPKETPEENMWARIAAMKGQPAPVATPTPTPTPAPTPPVVAPTYYWKVVNKTAKIVDSSGNLVPEDTQTSVLMNVGWDFSKIPQWASTGSTTPVTAQTASTAATGNTYTVKSGDTVSGIANQYGIPMSSISGYKSGNPNLIYPGEVLNIGGSTGVKATTEPQPQYSPLPEPTEPTEPTTPEEPTYRTPEQIQSELYNDYGIETKIDAWMNAPTETFEDVYSRIYTQLGLTGLQDDIKNIKDQIAAVQKQENENIADINDNPWISEGLRKIGVSAEQDKFQRELDRLTNMFTLAVNTYDRAEAKAETLATQALNAFNQQRTYQKEEIDFLIQRAQEDAAAKVATQAAETKFRYETMPDYLTKMAKLSEGEKPTIIGTESTGYYAYYPSTGKKELILGAAPSTSDLSKLLSFTEAEKMGVPYGTTVGEAIGQMPAATEKIRLDAVEKMSLVNKMINWLTDNEVHTGPEQVARRAIAEKTGKWTGGETQQEFESLIARIKAGYLFDIGGKQLTQTEMNVLTPFLPDLGNDESYNLTNLKEFKKHLQAIYPNYYSASSGTQSGSSGQTSSGLKYQIEQ